MTLEQDISAPQNSTVADNEPSEYTHPATPSMSPAGRWKRLVASWVDNFLYGLLLIPIFIIFQLILEGRLNFSDEGLKKLDKHLPFTIAIIILYLVYRIGFTIRDQATPGKSWRGLKVVRFSDGGELYTWQVITREVFKLLYYYPVLGSSLYLISASMVMFSPSRRGIHDIVSGAFVTESK